MTTRRSGLWVILLASITSSSCVESLQSQPQPAKFTTSFWYWHGYGSHSARAKAQPDAVYLHAGTIRREGGRPATGKWLVYTDFPESFPEAREYWLVVREEQGGVPDVAAVPQLLDTVAQLMGDARRQRLRVAGIQLDIDSPTGQLSHYADFLRALRMGMPAGLELSITALLDWFQNGTSIAEAIRETDEFVPQFYDIGPPGSGEHAIAAKIDAAKWAPRFNRFGKHYRIGISTFGRARFLPRPETGVTGELGLARFFGDLAATDIAGTPGFDLQTGHTDANELVLRYRALRKIQIGYNAFQPGDGVEFVLPTEAAIRTAVESARQMRGECAGVVFFRWPSSDETLVMQPDETLMAAGLAPREPDVIRVDAVDGQCAAVSCADLYLVNPGERNAQTARFRIRSSQQLEYFLPRERVPIRMAGASDLELTVPPYGGENRLPLGRAVTATRSEFHVEREP